MNLKIRYNSPVVLTFALLSMAVYFLNWLFWGDPSPGSSSLTSQFFTLRGVFNWSNPLDYLRMVSYPLGHANKAHIVGNMSIFLLIAPIMEEKYGSRNILLMMLFTAVLTGVFQIIIFNSGLLGASGIVFMFIVLVSFADAQKGSIPLTFILVVIFFVGKEILSGFDNNQVSEYAHIAGGFFGGLFGFMFKENKI